MTRRHDSREASSRNPWLARTVSRRTALALGASGLVLGRWFLPRQDRQRVVQSQLPEARGSGARDPASTSASGGEFRAFAVGDIGLGGATRGFTVAEMTACMAARRADAVLLLGDNFYPAGVASVEDEQWRSKFEQLFPAEVFPIPFYACLGNHDHSGNAAAQVEYTSRSQRWRMPAPFYAFSRDLGPERSVQFFVLDTQRIWKDHAADTPQLVWLENELARSAAGWKIVIGHHFLRSGGAHGEHGVMREVARRLEPLFERHGVDLYVSGHDHDLQLLRTDAGWLQAVSGAGSQLRDSGRTRDTLFAESKPGFAVLVVRPAELRIEFHAATEGLVHAHSVRKPLAEAARQAGLATRHG